MTAGEQRVPAGVFRRSCFQYFTSALAHRALRTPTLRIAAELRIEVEYRTVPARHARQSVGSTLPRERRDQPPRFNQSPIRPARLRTLNGG